MEEAVKSRDTAEKPGKNPGFRQQITYALVFIMLGIIGNTMGYELYPQRIPQQNSTIFREKKVFFHRHTEERFSGE